MTGWPGVSILILYVTSLMCNFCFSLDRLFPGTHFISGLPDQNGVSQACYIVEIYHSGPEPSRPEQNDISQACYIVEIYHSGPEPSRPEQNDISQACYIVEIYHSGPEPSRPEQNDISQACYIVEIYHSGPEPSRPEQNDISQACYIVEIYHSGPEPSMCCWDIKQPREANIYSSLAAPLRSSSPFACLCVGLYVLNHLYIPPL